MYIELKTFSESDGPTLKLRCPHCGHIGTFDKVRVRDIYAEGTYLGHRSCPNDECRGHIFFAKCDSKGTLITFPPVRIDFDKTNIPAKVLAAFEEARECHANGCYKAAGMMIRKTLEELCDQQGAKGKDLKDRIDDLRNKIVISKALMDSLHDLRLLGNDAAHIASKSFDDVGKDEVEVAAEVTKEILKALYQHDDLVKKLQKLKKPASAATP